MRTDEGTMTPRGPPLGSNARRSQRARRSLRAQNPRLRLLLGRAVERATACKGGQVAAAVVEVVLLLPYLTRNLRLAREGGSNLRRSLVSQATKQPARQRGRAATATTTAAIMLEHETSACVVAQHGARKVASPLKVLRAARECALEWLCRGTRLQQVQGKRESESLVGS